MAATRLIPLHVNKGKTIAQSLGDRTDYASNPEKTEKGELVSGYMCDPMTVDEEFLLSNFQRFAETRSHHGVMIRKGLGVSQQAISAEAEMCSQGQSWPREHCLPACEVTNILSKRKRQID